CFRLCPLADWRRLDRDLCGRLGFGACRSPGRRLLLRRFLSDHPSFSNRFSAPCRLGDGRFLAFRLGSSFCRHGSLPDAHCIWKVCVRSLPNKKVSQLARRPSLGTTEPSERAGPITSSAIVHSL